MARTSRKRCTGRSNWQQSRAALKLRHAVLVVSRTWGAAADAPEWPIERRMRQSYARADRVVVRNGAEARAALDDLAMAAPPSLLVLVPTHGGSTASPTGRDVLLFSRGRQATCTATVLARALLVCSHVHLHTCYVGRTLRAALRGAGRVADAQAMARRWPGQTFVVSALAKAISAAPISGPDDYLAHGCVVRGHGHCCAPAGLVVVARATWSAGALHVREVKYLNGRGA